jgi:hypothetical protein
VYSNTPQHRGSPYEVDQSTLSQGASSSDSEIINRATTATGAAAPLRPQDPYSRNSREAVGVRPNIPLLPIMQQRDFIEREMRWLIPMGVAHLQSLWEDDETDSRILDAIMDYALTTSWDRKSQQGESKGEQQRGVEEEGHGDSQSQYQTSTHFYSSPYELLMTLDAARRSVQSPSVHSFTSILSNYPISVLRKTDALSPLMP